LSAIGCQLSGLQLPLHLKTVSVLSSTHPRDTENGFQILAPAYGCQLSALSSPLSAPRSQLSVQDGLVLSFPFSLPFVKGAGRLLLRFCACPLLRPPNLAASHVLRLISVAPGLNTCRCAGSPLQCDGSGWACRCARGWGRYTVFVPS